MRTSSPALLPLLRSQTQAELLALLYLNPSRSYTLTEAARLIGATVKTVHVEADRLVGLGWLADTRQGRNRLLHATDSVLTGPLTALLEVTYGPRPILTDVLAGQPGVDEAYLYGSWAARHAGETGPLPNDVDVLVIGDVDVDVLDALAERASGRLHRPVQMRRVRPAVWAQSKPTDPFLVNVRSRPLLRLDLDPSSTAVDAARVGESE